MSRSLLAGFTALALMSFAPSYASSTSFLPLGKGFTYWQDGIPFEIDGLYIRVDNYLRIRDRMDLPDVIATAIHVFQTSGYATNVPDGVVAGYISVFYKDGTCEHLELIVGENTAEWAYDRRELQCCLAHTRIRPAFSWWTNLGSDAHYWGHAYAVSMNLRQKELGFLELVLDWGAYMDQPSCPAPCTQTDPHRYSILISAVTLELGSEKERQADRPRVGRPEGEDLRCGGLRFFADKKGPAAFPARWLASFHPWGMTAP